MKKGILLSFLFVIVFFTSLVWADANWVSHRAEDVRGGTFGDDEGDDTTSYIFDNPATFNEKIIAGDIIEDQDNSSYYIDSNSDSVINELEINLITAEKNLVITN